MYTDKSMINNKTMSNDNRLVHQQRKESEEKQFLQMLFHALHIPISNLRVGSRESGKPGYDFQAGQQVIELKRHIPFRHQRLVESLAYLEFLAQHENRDPSSVWCVVQVERLSERARHELESFCMRYKIQVQLVIVDNEGNVYRMDGWSLRRENVQAFPRIGMAIGPMEKSLLRFSGNQQWLLKFLLLNGIEPSYWPYPPNERLFISTALGRASGVSQSTCYELLKALEARGFYLPLRNGYRMRRLPELLKLWTDSLQKQRSAVLYLMPTRPGQRAQDWWNKKRSMGGLPGSHNLNARFSIGGGAACAWFQQKVVVDFSIAFHLASHQTSTLDQFLSLMGLVHAPGKSDIRVILHRSEKPAIEMIDFRDQANPYVDVLQAILDVLAEPRGREQFDKIVERVLLPFWKRKGWDE